MTQPYGSLYRRGKIWWISYYVDSIQQRESAHTKDRHEAEILLAKRKLQPVEPDARKVASLLDALKSHYLLQGKSPWGPLLIDAHLQPNFGKLHASAIDKAVLTAYVLKRKKQGRSHSTINKEISILRRTFSLAELKFPAFPKLARRKKEASVAAGLFLVFVLYSVYFSDTVAVVWVGVPFTVSTIGTAVPAVTPAGICRLNCCRPSVAPGVLPA